MNLKKTVLLLAAVAVVGTGGVMAASAPGYGRGMVDVEVILMSSQTAGYRTYYNEPFGYSSIFPTPHPMWSPRRPATVAIFRTRRHMRSYPCTAQKYDEFYGCSAVPH